MIDQHLDGCSDCRQTFALLAPSLARPAGDGPTARQRPGTAPARAGARPERDADDTVPIPSAPPRAGFGIQGRRVSRYALSELLGAGAMGVVCSAIDPELHREVAVKLMLGAWSTIGGNAARARVIHEARALARISHPNVIQVYDVGVVDDQVFIAMELVRGKNLRAYLRDAHPSLAEILELFNAAGQGLAAAHSAGVVHRDFKPDNVLVGDDGRVRVTDFGLALAAEPPEGASGPDQGADPVERDEPSEPGAGVVAGTPAYMAPEQHAGAHVDPRSDQFSFCVTLYEALYGERPFAGRTRKEVAAKVQAGKLAPRPPESRVPGSLHAILVRGLAPDPADRFPGMPDLLRALGRDRSRAPRRAVAGAAVALAMVLVALGADWIVRGRAAAAARASFAAARAQMSRLFELRTETFSALSSLSFFMPVMREVAAVADETDTGLGDPARDRAQLTPGLASVDLASPGVRAFAHPREAGRSRRGTLPTPSAPRLTAGPVGRSTQPNPGPEELHRNLASADWATWVQAAQGADIAVADREGRLLFNSAAPETWDRDVRAVAPIREVYATGSDGVRIAVVRADDPDLVASGLLGGRPQPGLYFLFTRLTVVGGRPRALFAQMAPGERLLGEIAPGEGTRVSMVAPDGTAAGSVPRAVVAAGLESRGIDEVEAGGERWLVQRHPLQGPGSHGGRAIADLILAYPAELGLAGLFAGARTVLGGLAIALAIAGLAAARLAAGRDLSRHPPRRVRGRARRVHP